MDRMANPSHDEKSASQRSSPDDSSADTTRAKLTLVRAAAHQPHTHRGMWNDDPIADPTALTQVNDWPAAGDFEPLIEQAKRAGDQLLVAQLEADRAFCAAARRQIQRAKQMSNGSSA